MQSSAVDIRRTYSVAMNAARTDVGDNVRSRTTVIQMETEGVPTVQQQTLKSDSGLRSLTPIINSMRVH